MATHWDQQYCMVTHWDLKHSRCIHTCHAPQPLPSSPHSDLHPAATHQACTLPAGAQGPGQVDGKGRWQLGVPAWVGKQCEGPGNTPGEEGPLPRPTGRSACLAIQQPAGRPWASQPRAGQPGGPPGATGRATTRATRSNQAGNQDQPGGQPGAIRRATRGNRAGNQEQLGATGWANRGNPRQPGG